MTNSAKTVFVFGLYLALVGLTLLLTPNFFLGTIGMPETNEVWIRFSGVLVMALAVYYVVAARHNLSIILKTTAYIRSTIIIFFAVFVYMDLMKPVMLLFGAVDLAGAIWTYTAMKKEGSW